MPKEVKKTFLLVNTNSIVHGLRIGHVISVHKTLLQARDKEKIVIEGARKLWFRGMFGGSFRAMTIVIESHGECKLKRGDWFPEVDFDTSKKFINHG